MRAKQPPAPRLQESPAREMNDLAAEQAALLEQTKWIDEQQKIVQIPIERAMELVAKNGLPDWPRVEVEAKQSSPDDQDKKKPAEDAHVAGKNANAKTQEQTETKKPMDDEK
jgi:hypothetical protein